MDSLQINKLISKIDTLPDEFLIIKKQAKKYLKNNSNIDKHETINVFHRPWIAPLNWSLMLFKGADKVWFEQF